MKPWNARDNAGKGIAHELTGGEPDKVHLHQSALMALQPHTASVTWSSTVEQESGALTCRFSAQTHMQPGSQWSP